MKSNRSCIVFLSLLFLSLSATARLADWTAIQNTNDAHLKEIVDFAVTEHNKQSGEKLKLERIIKGQSQVVSGISYCIVLVANDGTTAKNYTAVVFEKPWEHYKNLTSFKPLVLN